MRRRTALLVFIGVFTAFSAAWAGWSFAPAGSNGKRFSIQGANWKGDYAPGTAYAQNDVVLYSDGNNYISLSAGNLGNTPASSPIKWQPVSLKGATGAAGPTGPTGPAGAGVSTGSDGGYGIRIAQNSSVFNNCTTAYNALFPTATGWSYCVGKGAAVQIGASTLPTQTGNGGKYLTTDGATASWSTVVGGGSGTFRTAQLAVQSQLSSGRWYEGQGYYKHTLPATAANQSFTVFANITSLALKPATGSDYFRGLTTGTATTAGHSIYIPKGSVYQFVSTAANGIWLAIKQIGSSFTQLIQEFIAELSWSPTSHDFGSTTQGVLSNYSTTLLNTGSATTVSLAFSNLSSTVFRTYSTPTSIAAGGSVKVKYQFLAPDTGTHTGHLVASATGIADAILTLTGTGLAGGGEGSAPGSSTVWWSASSSTLNTYNATDGSAVTLVGSPAFVTGYTGDGLHVTGAGAAHFVATSGNSISASSGRAEFDFKSDGGFPGNPSAWFFVHDYNSSDGRLAFYYTTSTAASFQYAGTVYGLTTADLFDNAWHHVKVEWVANGTVAVTVDANSPVSVAIGAAPSMPTGNLWWGNRASDTARPVNGILDNIVLGP